MFKPSRVLFHSSKFLFEDGVQKISNVLFLVFNITIQYGSEKYGEKP